MVDTYAFDTSYSMSNLQASLSPLPSIPVMIVKEGTVDHLRPGATVSSFPGHIVLLVGSACVLQLLH